ncbi:unnamed protein product, partial [Oppiella nova]
MDIKQRNKSHVNFDTEFTGSTDWECVDYHSLPKWLQDNKYLHRHHRPV